MAQNYPGAGIRRQAVAQPAQITTTPRPVPVAPPPPAGLPSYHPPPPAPYPWPVPDAFGYNSPVYRSLYREMALIFAGIKLPEEFTLEPFHVTQWIPLVTREGGGIVALDADRPSFTLHFDFPVFSFVQRMSARVLGCKLTEHGQPEAGFIEADPKDYVTMELSYAQQSQNFSNQPVLLSECSGANATLAGAYFYSALPFVPKGTRLLANLSILLPDAFSGGSPPFVTSVGFVSITFDTVIVPVLNR